MNDYLIKAIDKTKNLHLLAVASRNLVSRAQERHDTWSVSGAVLRKTLTGGLLLATANLVDKQELTVRLMGNGPAGACVVAAKSNFTVKGYISNPHVALPPRNDSHTGVKKAVDEGWLQVTKDQGLSGPYTGEVPIVSGEIAEDLTYYLAKSEQIPSTVGLSVFVQANNTIGVAGGFMLQALLRASDELLSVAERRIKELPNISSLFLGGITPEQLAEKILGDDCKILEKDKTAYACGCSEEKSNHLLTTLKKADLQEMISGDHGAELTCQFCKEKYHFSDTELRAILTEQLEK